MVVLVILVAKSGRAELSGIRASERKDTREREKRRRNNTCLPLSDTQKLTSIHDNQISEYKFFSIVICGLWLLQFLSQVTAVRLMHIVCVSACVHVCVSVCKCKCR